MTLLKKNGGATQCPSFATIYHIMKIYQHYYGGRKREKTKTNMARWCWGSTFADLNNDGWLDILGANGFITAEDTGDL